MNSIASFTNLPIIVLVDENNQRDWRHEFENSTLKSN
jgi:hypothetical protein